jgi:FtsH-binding integral membrane protein
MRKEKTLLVLGVWIAVLPFLGFPNSWRTTFFVLSGFALIYLSYIFYQESRIRKEVNESKTFVDNVEGRE